MPGSAGRRVDAFQAEGGRQSRRRPASRTPDARPHWAEPHADAGRQSGLGCARGHRVDARSGRGGSMVDRRANQPRRCARPCRNCQGNRANKASPLARWCRTACSSSSSFRRMRSASARSTPVVLGGVNEVLAICCWRRKFGVPVCPHAGGVGLCEYVQHLAMFDYIAVSGSLEGRVIEYVDHLHEHFVDPVVVRHGRYMPPTAPGYSITMKPESIAAFTFPTGPAWRENAHPKRRSLTALWPNDRPQARPDRDL